MPSTSTLSRPALAAALACLLAGAAPATEPTYGAFDAMGVKIRYVTQGAGEPVVLVHGLYASAALNWQLPGIFATLAKDHHVIAIDLPGHGGSDKPAGDDAYGVQLAEDVVLLMDHLKVPKAHVVGYSLGGMITLKLMTLHPDRVLSGTLGGMGWLQEGGRNQKTWERMRNRESGTQTGLIPGIAKLAVTEDALKAIKLPVAVICGDRDVVYRLYVDPLKAVRKDWPVVDIAGAGHLDCIVNKEFRAAIVVWLDKNRQK